MTCKSTLTNAKTLLVSNGQYGIVHLTEAVTETEYFIQYALSDTVDNQEKFWSDVKVNGEKLVLKPENTPLILNLPGAYRLVENSQTTGTIRTAVYPVANFAKGDVK